jgi:hypothetical protein
VLAATLLSLAGVALAQGASIAGVWRLAAPQTLLKSADGGSIPFTEQGRATYEANKTAAAQGDYRFDPTMSGCASPGQPRLMLTPDPFIILQRASMITFLYQWNRLFRQIIVGKQLQNPLLSPDYADFLTSQGYSDGRWEGDTLVVHTIGLSDKKLLDNLLPNSDRLELTERIRVRAGHRLEDRITITDPVMYSRAWDTVLNYERQPDRLFPFPEHVCLDYLDAKQPPLPPSR